MLQAGFETTLWVQVLLNDVVIIITIIINFFYIGNYINIFYKIFILQ